MPYDTLQMLSQHRRYDKIALKISTKKTKHLRINNRMEVWSRETF